MVQLVINDRQCQVLIDTGCTDNIVFEGRCFDWTPRRVPMITIGGGTLECCGVGRIDVRTVDRRVTLSALVVPVRPMGVDVVIGMKGITALGGVAVGTPLHVQVGLMPGRAAERGPAPGRAVEASPAAGAAAGRYNWSPE